MSKIRKTLPRDQSQSNEYYNFQHGETARGCLKMLKEGHFNHVFCEWHDDFVEVRTSNEKEEYTFCQVKGKKLSESKFGFATMFGLNYAKKISKLKKAPKIDTDAILYKQFLLYLEFGDECEKFKVLTNFEFGDHVADFLNYAKGSLSGNMEYEHNLQRLQLGYNEEIKDHDITLEKIKQFFSLVELVPNCNILADFKIQLYYEISQYLEQVREVSFAPKHIHKMIDNLLSLIETRAKFKFGTAPESDHELLSRKAILLTDVLEYIGVSRDIFMKLEGDIEDRLKTIRTTSRLERLVKSKDLELIKDFLKWKTEWDVWIHENKSKMRPQDQIAIRRIFSEQMPKEIDDLNIETALERAIEQLQQANIVFDDNDNLRHQNLVLGGLLATIIEFEAPLND